MADISSDFHLMINDKILLPREKAHLGNLECDEGFDKMAMLKFDIRQSEAVSLSQFDFKLGAPIGLHLKNANMIGWVFVGVIYEVEPVFPKDEPCYLSITCHDLSYRLKQSTGEEWVLTEPTMKKNIEDLLYAHGITDLIIEPKRKLKNLADDQSYKVGGRNEKGEPGPTAWKILTEIARNAGLKLFMRAQVFYMVDAAYLLGKQRDKFRFVYRPTPEDLRSDTIPIIDMNVTASLMEKRSTATSQWWDVDKKRLSSDGKPPPNKQAEGERDTTADLPPLTSPDFLKEEPAPADVTGVQTQVLPEGAASEFYGPPAPPPDDPFWSEPKEQPPKAMKSTLFLSPITDLEFGKLRKEFVPPLAASMFPRWGQSFAVLPSNRLNNLNIKTKDQADEAAKAHQERILQHLTEAKVTIPGNPLIKMGQFHTIEIKDFGFFGKHFSGEYMVDSVHHAISDEGYITEVTFIRPYLFTLLAQGLIKI